MIVAVSDRQEVIKVGQKIVVRETIRRTEASEGRVLVITSVTKIFMSAALIVPEEHQRRALLLVNPPPADKMTVKEALRSPAKKTITVAGRIVQEDESNTVVVQGENVTIKTVTIDDGSDRAKVTLWRDLAMAEMCDAPEEKKVIDVEGVSVTDSKIELFLQDDSVMVVPSELLHAALATADRPHVDL